MKPGIGQNLSESLIWCTLQSGSQTFQCQRKTSLLIFRLLIMIYLQIFIALPLLKSRPKPNLICSFVRFMFPLAIPWVPESGSIGRVWIYWKLYKYWALTLLRLFVIYEGNYFCKCGKCLILLLTKDGNQSSSI